MTAIPSPASVRLSVGPQPNEQPIHRPIEPQIPHPSIPQPVTSPPVPPDPDEAPNPGGPPPEIPIPGPR